MITGKLFKNSIICAANNISAHRKEIDALNVFPVPDGDTGTNMSMTINAAAREVALLPDSATVSQVADKTASALLRGARGNSGVILSLIFRGISKSVKGKETMDGSDVAQALVKGKEAAYKAVMKPTEGTILTVIRVASERATKAAEKGDDLMRVCKQAYVGASQALADTPNILPVLKNAGVVDAGGQGLVFIFDGIKKVLFDGVSVDGVDAVKTGEAIAPTVSAAGSVAADIKFTYCTEFIVNRELTEQKPEQLRQYLESIGDCVVVVDDDEIIKVHVHSNEPGNAIQKALEYGQLVSIKVENMREQHKNAEWVEQSEPESTQPQSYDSAKPEKRYGMVAVASGEGIENMFREIGVDEIVTGGQTMNPSTEDILAAVAKTPAEHVFILPNNKNIIMAAEQVAPLTDKGVSVLHTRSIPQGITAALNLDENAEPDANHMAMMKAAKAVETGLVTFAARDSSIEGQHVKKGEILGMENGKITFADEDMLAVAYKITKHMIRRNPSSLVTIYYGEEVKESKAQELASMLKARYGNDIEISVIFGGQPVYYFIISVE